MTCRTGTGILFLEVLKGEPMPNTRPLCQQSEGGQDILGRVVKPEETQAVVVS